MQEDYGISSKEEIESVFVGGPYVKDDDDEHSQHEKRFLAIGVANSGQACFCCFYHPQSHGRAFDTTNQRALHA